MKPILLLTTAACLSGMAASPQAVAQAMPFRSSLHDVALTQALGDSVLSLAQTPDNPGTGSPWSQWQVRPVRLSALVWGKKVLWRDATGQRSTQGAYYRDGMIKPLAWAKEATVTVGGDQQNMHGIYWLVYLRDGDSLIAADYRPLLKQWLPEGTKIVQTRGECPPNSTQVGYESDQVYQLTLPGKKPLWVEVGTFGRVNDSPAPHLTLDFALSPQPRWQCDATDW